MFWLWTFLLYLIIFYVALYFVSEFAQNYFYDELTPKAWLKVGIASLILAGLLTWRNPTLVDMFTSRLGETALLAIVGFAVFTVALSFHPPHAAMIGPAVVVLVSAVTALAVESLSDGGQSLNRDRRVPTPTIRKSAGTSFSPVTPAEEPKAAKP
jgi:peptidoglycan/LPS O-acetylase OafA/YrhL